MDPGDLQYLKKAFNDNSLRSSTIVANRCH